VSIRTEHGDRDLWSTDRGGRGIPLHRTCHPGLREVPPATVIGLEWVEVLEDQPEWTGLARCVGTDPELFFPERGQPGHQAKRICAGCPVRLLCRERAIPDIGLRGIWGGLTERERQIIRGRQQRGDRY
jgi:WhiB family redox-sensing transcriptional regulator